MVSSGAYADIVDFDDSLKDATLDWRNLFSVRNNNINMLLGSYEKLRIVPAAKIGIAYSYTELWCSSHMHIIF